MTARRAARSAEAASGDDEGVCPAVVEELAAELFDSDRTARWNASGGPFRKTVSLCGHYTHYVERELRGGSGSGSPGSPSMLLAMCSFLWK